MNMSSPETELRGVIPMSICLLIVGIFCCAYTPALAGTITYAYDRFGNLQTAIYPDAGRIHYVYDAAGNRVTQIVRRQGRDFCLTIKTATGRPLAGLTVTLVDENGLETGIQAATNNSGTALLELDGMPPGNYGFKVMFLDHGLRSNFYSFPDETDGLLVIDEETVEVVQAVTMTVIGDFLSDRAARESVPVRLSAPDGTDLDLEWTTDHEGKVHAWLPKRKFIASAHYLGRAYASDPFIWENPVIVIDEGLAWVTVTRLGTPLKGADIQVFSADGAVLPVTGTTDGNGQAVFRLPEGTYSFESGISGHACDSGEIFIPAHGIMPVAIKTGDGNVCPPLSEEPHQAVPFTIVGDDRSIDEGMALVQVTGTGIPQAGINVQVYSGSGKALNITGTTGAGGTAVFRLPAGEYRFRADHGEEEYWSGTGYLASHVENPVQIRMDGTIELTVSKDTGEPLSRVPVSLLTESGTPLYISGLTNDKGQVFFDIPEGTYRFEAEYLGYSFRSDRVSVPEDASAALVIPHRAVAVSVRKVFDTASVPLEDLKVHLETGDGKDLDTWIKTGPSGTAVFDLPEKPFQFRADYLGSHFRSGSSAWQDVTIEIAHGVLDVYVTRENKRVENAGVYVFSPSGIYLKRHLETRGQGDVTFTIPEGEYMIMVRDHAQFSWYGGIDVTAHHRVGIELPMMGKTEKEGIGNHE